jgi:hypothetical protein
MTHRAPQNGVTVRSTSALYLDSLLLLIFLLLLSPRLTGLRVHEALGLSFVSPIFFHLLIARAWITLSIKRFWNLANRRARVNVCLNVVLFVLIVIEIFSGLMISRVALPYVGLRTINDRAWRLLHNLALNWTLMVVGLHIAMNWTWIMTAFRRRVSNKPSAVVLAIPLGAAFGWICIVSIAAAIVAVGSIALLGWPTQARVYLGDEIVRFSPSMGHGMVQLLGESFLVAVIAYVGRRWLRIRL